VNAVGPIRSAGSMNSMNRMPIARALAASLRP